MASLFRRPLTRCTSQRAFSTSHPRPSSLQWDKNDPSALADVVPEYPYGPARWYKQSDRGLYGGQRIRFGNIVSPKHQTKSRRTWEPNIVMKRMHSKALNRYVQIRVSTRVLRTIDKLGGLDEYLLGEKEARIKELGESGWWLRWAIMQSPSIRKRFGEERQALGMSEQEAATNQAQNEAEAEALAEDPTGRLAAENEEEAAEEETLVTDSAFVVEQTDDLPPLKWRVGPGQHLMLTPDGWRRTRPNLQRWVDMTKAKIRQRLEKLVVEPQVAEFERQLLDILSSPMARNSSQIPAEDSVTSNEKESVRSLSAQNAAAAEASSNAARADSTAEGEKARVRELHSQMETHSRQMSAEEREALLDSASSEFMKLIEPDVERLYAEKQVLKAEGKVLRREEKKGRKAGRKARDEGEGDVEPN